MHEAVEFLEIDRPLCPGHNAIKAAAKDYGVLEAVETESGELDSY